MKKLTLIIFVSLVINANGQVFENSKLGFLLANSRMDSIQKIERTASLKFHKLINHYRSINNTDTLSWDETLWLTSRNHNIWMNGQAQLSHDEKKGTKHFTGQSPGERYSFTSNGVGKCNWSGENALYHWDKSGNTIDEISSNIASTSFSQWKNSKGHNENMLAKGSKAHGVAFHLGMGGRVWGTDLFSYTRDDVKSDREIYASHVAVFEELEKEDNEPEPKAVKHVIKKSARINLVNTKNELLMSLYNSSNFPKETEVKRNKNMETAAERHTAYMASTKLVTHEEKSGKSKFYGETERKRMMKASNGFFFFKRKTKLTESIAMVEADIATFDLGVIVNEINLQLDKENKINSTKIDVGYGVSLKRNKNQLKIYVTRVGGNKRSTNV